MIIVTEPYHLSVVFCFLVVRFGRASRLIFPTATLAGLSAANIQFDILPTPNSWTPSDLSKRFANDPAICGWVEALEGKSYDLVSCNSGYTCAASSTFVGCCSKGDSSCTNLVTTCYDEQGKSYDATYTSNPNALICEGRDQSYCVTYRYASGSRGYGCGGVISYDKTVLTVTDSPTSPTPFGHVTFTTSTASTSASASASTGAASSLATAMSVTRNSMSVGAIAGTVVGSVAGVVILLLIFLLFVRKYQKKRAQQQKDQTFRGSYPLQDQPIYDQYGKLVYSPAWSPQGHSRHQSDGQSELAGVPVSPDPFKNPLASPSISEADGRPFSPETIELSPSINHGLSDAGQQGRPAELPDMDR